MSARKIGNQRYLTYLSKINVSEAEYFSKTDKERKIIWIDYMAWRSKHAALYNASKGQCIIVDHNDFDSYLRKV